MSDLNAWLDIEPLLPPSMREAYDPSEARGHGGEWVAGDKKIPATGATKADIAKVKALKSGDHKTRLSTGHTVEHRGIKDGGKLTLRDKTGRVVKTASHKATAKSILNAHHNIIGAIQVHSNMHGKG